MSLNTLLLDSSRPSLEKAASLLREGRLVALPTETVYGLGANGLEESAVKAIFLAKGRPQDNPLILHIADRASLAPLVRIDGETGRRLLLVADAFWPGPLTVVLPKSGLVSPAVTAGLDTVAVRMPSHPVARALISLAGLPIAAPSANLSGSPSPTTAAHVLSDLSGKIDAVVDGGPCEVGVESTVLDLSRPLPRLLRPGGISLSALRGTLGLDVEVDRAVTAALSEGEEVRAPGMKYRHYAPKTPLAAVTGPNAAALMLERAKKEGGAILCFDETLPFFRAHGIPCVSYGPENDFSAQAHSLFSALRALDAFSKPIAFAQMTASSSDRAMAVVNRLSKSAGFHILRTEEPLI